jgi:hypothetical protein
MEAPRGPASVTDSAGAVARSSPRAFTAFTVASSESADAFLKDLADSPEDLADSPEDLADSPEDLADSQEDRAGSPEDRAGYMESLAGFSIDLGD